jgi:hypothetical protein
LNETPPVDPNSSTEKLKEYFAVILPNFDRERVHASDIKKAIRWFTFLNDRGLLTGDPESDEEE